MVSLVPPLRVQVEPQYVIATNSEVGILLSGIQASSAATHCLVLRCNAGGTSPVLLDTVDRDGSLYCPLPAGTLHKPGVLQLSALPAIDPTFLEGSAALSAGCETDGMGNQITVVEQATVSEARWNSDERRIDVIGDFDSLSSRISAVCSVSGDLLAGTTRVQAVLVDGSTLACVGLGPNLLRGQSTIQVSIGAPD